MNDRSDNFLFGFVFLVCPAAYILLLALPRILFCIVPFLISSLVIGSIWTAVCHRSPVNYLRFAWLVMGMIFLLLVTVGFPSTIPLGQTKVYLESPFLFQAYNYMNSGIQGFINASPLKFFRPVVPFFLPPQEYQQVLYDLRDLAWALWLGVCFGAPGLFLYRAKEKDRDHIAKLMDQIEEAKIEYRHLSYAHDCFRNYLKEEKAEKEAVIAKLKALELASASASASASAADSSPSAPEEGGVFKSKKF